MSDLSSVSLDWSEENADIGNHQSVDEDALLADDTVMTGNFFCEPDTSLKTLSVTDIESDASSCERFVRLKPSAPTSEAYKMNQEISWRPEISADLLPVLEGARYFLLHSANWKNVIRSQEYGFWAAVRNTEDKLNAAYQNTRSVILISCVPCTSQFTGFARLASMSHPQEWKWDTLDGKKTAHGGVFRVDWLSRESLDFALTTHLVPGLDSTKPVCSCADGQEIPGEIARELLRLLSLDEKVSMRSIISKCQQADSLQATRRQHQISSLDLRQKLGPRNRYHDDLQYGTKPFQFTNPWPGYSQDPRPHPIGWYAPVGMVPPYQPPPYQFPLLKPQPSPVRFTDGMFTYQYDKGVPKLKLSHTSKERQDYQMYLKKHSMENMNKNIELSPSRDHTYSDERSMGEKQYYHTGDRNVRKKRVKHYSKERKSHHVRTYRDSSSEKYKKRKHHRSCSSHRRHENMHSSSDRHSREEPRGDCYKQVADTNQDDHHHKADKHYLHLAKRQRQTKNTHSSSYKNYRTKSSDVDSFSDSSSSSSYKGDGKNKRYRSSGRKHLPKQYKITAHEDTPQRYSREKFSRSESHEGSLRYHRSSKKVHTSAVRGDTPEYHNKSYKKAPKSHEYTAQYSSRSPKRVYRSKSHDIHAKAIDSHQMNTAWSSYVSTLVMKTVDSDKTQEDLYEKVVQFTNLKALEGKPGPNNQTSYIHVHITESLQATVINESHDKSSPIPVLVSNRE